MEFITDKEFYCWPKDFCGICGLDIDTDKNKRICTFDYIHIVKQSKKPIKFTAVQKKYASIESLASIQESSTPRLFVTTVTRSSGITARPLTLMKSLWKMLIRKKVRPGKYNGSALPGSGEVLWVSRAHITGAVYGSVLAPGSFKGYGKSYFFLRMLNY